MISAIPNHHIIEISDDPRTTEDVDDKNGLRRNVCCRATTRCAHLFQSMGCGLSAGALSAGRLLSAFPKFLARQYAALNTWYRKWNMPIHCLPASFLQNIEQQNKEKDNNAPIALILLTETDGNKALSSTGAQQLISMFAKTHRIALESIAANRQIQENIQKHRLGGSEDVVVLASHGDNSRLEWSESPDPDSHLTADNVRKEFFEGLHPQTLIFSIGCNTGFVLAQKIADVTGRRVQAPVDVLYPAHSWVHKCGRHGLELCAYNSSNANIIRTFTPHQIGNNQKFDPIRTCIDLDAFQMMLHNQINQLRSQAETNSIYLQNVEDHFRNLEELIHCTDSHFADPSEHRRLQHLQVQHELVLQHIQKISSSFQFFP